MATTVAAVAAVLPLVACAAPPATTLGDDRLQVITTTGILADLVANVGGEHVNTIALVPEGGDPHSYEPSLRDVRDIVYADAAFTNYLMLEEQNLISTIDANLPADAANISLAEESVKYAANIIPLVEDVGLDTVWLGMRVDGASAAGFDRRARVRFSATSLEGPGELHTYLTGSFGDIDQYINSSDGVRGDDEDAVSLPGDAHTHLSWAFTEPGYYTLGVDAQVQRDSTAAPTPVAEGEVVFAVGVDPHAAPDRAGATVIDAGHADISVALDRGVLELLHDPDSGDTARDFYPLDDVVISVPNTALQQIPGEPAYRFLGEPAAQIYQLPQAVLGKHVHGEIDPHLWHDVANAQAYVQVIRDTLIDLDPAHAADYTRNASHYLEQLDALDAEVRELIAQIPESRRTLITTHDSFAYLAEAYDLTVAGFVTPNPAVEPSLADRQKLATTIRNLQVPAVFLEPNLVQRASTLQEVATDEGVRVCEILGDSFTPAVHTYIDLMRFNAHSLVDCLGAPA